LVPGSSIFDLVGGVRRRVWRSESSIKARPPFSKELQPAETLLGLDDFPAAPR